MFKIRGQNPRKGVAFINLGIFCVLRRCQIYHLIKIIFNKIEKIIFKYNG